MSKFFKKFFAVIFDWWKPIELDTNDEHPAFIAQLSKAGVFVKSKPVTDYVSDRVFEGRRPVPAARAEAMRAVFLARESGDLSATTAPSSAVSILTNVGEPLSGPGGSGGHASQR